MDWLSNTFYILRMTSSQMVIVTDIPAIHPR